MRKISIAILITLLIILTLLITLLVNNKKMDSNINNININNSRENILITNRVENVIQNTIYNDDVEYNFIETNQLTEERVLKKLKYVQEKTDYFTIKNIVNNYLELLNSNNVGILEKIIAPQYIEEFNKFNNNFPKKNNEEESYYIDIKNMYEAIISDKTKIYIIDGDVSLKNSQEKYPLNIMIAADTVNLLYNIYPSEYLYKYNIINLKAGDIIEFDEPIIYNRNDINKYSYEKAPSNAEVAKIIFNDYIYKLNTDITGAYNKLNKQYMQKRFPTIELFKERLNNLNRIINLIEYKESVTNKRNNYKDYVCADQYGNTYVFREEGGVMRYTAFLDTYTIETDILKEGYENSYSKQQININLEKISQMINHKDYETLYSKLDSTFKANNYETIEKFKDFIVKNFYNINKLNLINNQSNSDYYVCTCKIIDQEKVVKENENKEKETDQKGENVEEKQITIIMKLTENNDFIMSFSM